MDDVLPEGVDQLSAERPLRLRDPGLGFILYNVINLTIIHFTGAVDTVPLGVEPILFGVFCMGFDVLLIQVKHFLVGLFKGQR